MEFFSSNYDGNYFSILKVEFYSKLYRHHTKLRMFNSYYLNIKIIVGFYYYY